MQCQREGCDEKATLGVQIVSATGYRVGLCPECAQTEVDSFEGTMDPPYVIPIKECHWWVGSYTAAGIEAHKIMDDLQRKKK